MSENKKKRIVVLGAGGQIGKTIVSRLGRATDLSVVGVVRNALTAAPLRAAGLEVRLGNILAADQRERLIGDADIIVNCASASALWGQARTEDRAVIDAVMMASRARLIHFSSVAVYGTCLDPVRNTYEHPRPDAPYGRDKLNLERHVEAKGKKASHAKPVILRMGHVYGPEQWVSRYVLDRATGTIPGFSLPFDGRLPSNAVHVANVASAVNVLVHDDKLLGTFNLFDPGQSTWRAVFDWNTHALGMAPVASLSPEMSERLRLAFRRRAAMAVPVAVAHDVTGWLKSLPMSLVAASPSLRDLALSTMSTLQSSRFEQKVLAVYGEMSVRRLSEPLPIKETWLLSEGAPGPTISFPDERDASQREAVAAWYNGFASPDALFGSVDQVPSGSVAASASSALSA